MTEVVPSLTFRKYTPVEKLEISNWFVLITCISERPLMEKSSIEIISSFPSINNMDFVGLGYIDKL